MVMNAPERERELKEKWRLELKQNEQAYTNELNNHPATEHIKAICNWPDPSTLTAAVVYLLKRARNDDVGSPP
jgi:hypothetical protein